MTVKSILETINWFSRDNILRQGIPKGDNSESKNIGPQYRFTVSFQTEASRRYTRLWIKHIKQYVTD